MTSPLPPYLATLQRRESLRDHYHAHRDPIAAERMLWQAQSFRHMVHLLPGEPILEIGGGAGGFTRALVSMTRGRNPLTSVTSTAAGAVETVEWHNIEALPGPLAGRTFRYIVAYNILDRDNIGELMGTIFDLLEEGGRCVFFEANPWNLLYSARHSLRRMMDRPDAQSLLDRTQLYELFSEIGFIRVSARFTDFVYAPLAPTRGMAWLLRNLSVLLENAPVVKSFAGQIILHAQKPPRTVPRNPVSLCRHDSLKGAVSFVVPCHNEEMNIPPLVDGLRQFYGDYIHQIVLVNDNSRDRTAEVMDRLAAEDPRITPVHRTPPNGVGRALRDGYAAATGRYVMSMDCDFQHLLPEMEDMFEAAADGADAVFGSRFSRSSVLINYPFGKIFANRSFHALANVVLRFGRRDVTNNLKLMHIDLVRQLVIEEPWFAANAEIGLQLALLGKDVREVPISWINRTFDMGTSSFKVLKSGGGYARVLWRFAKKTGFGRRALETAPAAE
ncbi:MAG TPA: glycosyltransferase [Candidatus Omnitrophota bacterium]|nr:glycosyltransferase [Candidatus Omnitrophota bacterium]